MNANSISLHRMKNLFRYEWAIDKKFYLLGSLGIFIISFGVFLTIWFNNVEGFVWRSVDYNLVFFNGFLFLSVFGISQGFVELREKKTAIRYLTLPASQMEKYLVQVCLRLVLPLILYPIVFWLGANLSVDIYHFIQRTLLERIALPEIHKAEILYLYWIPNSSMEVGYWMLFGVIVSVPVLMFMGGIVFGKWGFIGMPFSIAFIVLILMGSFFGLSWLVNASPFGLGGDYSIRIDNPEVFDGVPLITGVGLVLIWPAVFLSFIVTYFKLKEREV